MPRQDQVGAEKEEAAKKSLGNERGYEGMPLRKEKAATRSNSGVHWCSANANWTS